MSIRFDERQLVIKVVWYHRYEWPPKFRFPQKVQYIVPFTVMSNDWLGMAEVEGFVKFQTKEVLYARSKKQTIWCFRFVVP